uniref:Innexin n=1 Tax=Heterorhabditis bacteriophora TaxID=37862 RepID=A0A1I7XEP3_HETBA
MHRILKEHAKSKIDFKHGHEFLDVSEMFFIILVFFTYHCLGIEYPWTFDNDLFGDDEILASFHNPIHSYFTTGIEMYNKTVIFKV